ncbi:MAG: hypothetical protein ACFFCO_09115 [Promethearchaeota archaeon]
MQIEKREGNDITDTDTAPDADEEILIPRKTRELIIIQLMKFLNATFTLFFMLEMVVLFISILAPLRPEDPYTVTFGYTYVVLWRILQNSINPLMIPLMLSIILILIIHYFFRIRIVPKGEFHTLQVKGTERQYLAVKHYLRRTLILLFFVIPFLFLEYLRFLALIVSLMTPPGTGGLLHFSAVLEWFTANQESFIAGSLFTSFCMYIVFSIWFIFNNKEDLAAFRFENFLGSLSGGRNKLWRYRKIVRRFNQALENVEALVKPYVKISNQRLLVGMLGSLLLSNSSSLDSIQVEVAGLTVAVAEDDSEKTVGHLTKLVELLSGAQEECKVFEPETTWSRWRRIKQLVGRDAVLRLLVYLTIAAILFIFWLLTGFRIPIPP